MAGRSGAAAIEMELREAAEAFSKQVPRLAERLRGSNAALAESLFALLGRKPRLERLEAELYLHFADGPAEQLDKVDITDELSYEFGEVPYGVEVQSSDGVVYGVSLYLQ